MLESQAARVRSHDRTLAMNSPKTPLLNQLRAEPIRPRNPTLTGNFGLTSQKCGCPARPVRRRSWSSQIVQKMNGAPALNGSAAVYSRKPYCLEAVGTGAKPPSWVTIFL